MPTFTLMDANNGEKHVLLEGWKVKAVFVDADHEEFGKEVLEAMNEKREREEGTRSQREKGTTSMTYKEIEKLDRAELERLLAFNLFEWKETTILDMYVARAARGIRPGCTEREDCPAWTNDPWEVIDKMRECGYRVNIAEVAPHVGEVIVVEHSEKHPKQDRVEVTCYYGLAEGMASCAIAVCRASVMALLTPMRLKKKYPY